jgi:peptidoglycan/LPS O-acetylase OafA/YrhL
MTAGAALSSLADARPAAASHRPQLDALRALAVIAVLLVHFWPTLPSFGQEAVRLFFVLSGFLITSQLLDGRAALGMRAPDGGRWRVIGRFFARRALRIFPAYYLLLALLVLANAPDVRRDVVAHAAYASNLLAAARNDWGSGVTTHLWSLATEEQFYLVWPLLVVLLPLRVLPLVAAAAIGLAPAVRVALLAGANPGGEPPIALWVLPPTAFDALGCGALLALWRNDATARAGLRRAGVIAFALWLVATLVARIGSVPALIPFDLTVVPVLWALACCALVDAASRGVRGAAGAVLDSRVLRYLGRISYGIYLYHLPAYWALSVALQRLHLPAPDGEPAKFMLGSALAIAVAALSWHAFEQPINRLKQRWPSG